MSMEDYKKRKLEETKRSLGVTRDFEPMFPSSFTGALKTLDDNTAKPIRYATNEAIKTGKPWEFFKGLAKGYTEEIPDVSGKEIAGNLGVSQEEFGADPTKPLRYSGSGISESPFKTSKAGIVGFGLENLLDAENLIPAGKAMAVGGLALGGLKKVGKAGDELFDLAKRFKSKEEFLEYWKNPRPTDKEIDDYILKNNNEGLLYEDKSRFGSHTFFRKNEKGKFEKYKDGPNKIYTEIDDDVVRIGVGNQLSQYEKNKKLYNELYQENKNLPITEKDLLHGTGINFKKFKREKLRSGEGVNAFGAGTYITDTPEISKYYYDKIGSIKAKTNSYKKMKFINNETGDEWDGKEIYDWSIENDEDFLNNIEYNFSPKNNTRMTQQGAMLKLRMKPKEYTLMKWEDEISPEIKQQLGINENITTKEYYKQLTEKFGDKTKASDYLESKGIDGIEYETGSLGFKKFENEGSNYVIFNPENLKVEKSYTGSLADNEYLKDNLSYIWEQANQPTQPLTNSLGRPVHPTAEGQENFKKWFEGSKVVDEKGSPIVAYHGTKKNFDIFNQDDLGLSFFTTNPEFAHNYARYKGGIYPTYLKSKKPFDPENQDHRRVLINELFKTLPVYKLGDGQDALMWDGRKSLYTKDVIEEALQQNNSNWGFIEQKQNIDAIKKMGFDAVYVSENGVKNIAVFDPEQIKSATGNSGKFNPKDPNILKGLAPVGPWMLYQQQKGEE